MRSVVAVLGFCLSLGVCHGANAQESWTLLASDLTSEPVTLQGIDAAGLKIVGAAGDSRVVAMDRFVELTRDLPAPPEPGGPFELHLASGDRLAGQPAAVKGESIVWKHPLLGEVPVPLRQMAALTRQGVPLPDERRGREDVVRLANNDVVRGTIADLTAEQITLQTDAGATPIPFDAIQSVTFAAAAGAAREKPGIRVRLDDGSSLVADSVKLAEGKLTLDLGKAGPRELESARVAGIEQMSGPVSWLSSRPPSEMVYTPFLGSHDRYPARMNRSVEGGPIVFGERKFARGIGVHSYSKLVWSLDGGDYKVFRTRYAIDPAQQNTGAANVTVRIIVDDKVVHEQANVRAGTLSAPVTVDLNGGKTLTLEVDFGQNIDSQDRLNWIEPALLKHKPAAAVDAPPVTPATKPATTPAKPATAPAKPEA